MRDQLRKHALPLGVEVGRHLFPVHLLRFVLRLAKHASMLNITVSFHLLMAGGFHKACGRSLLSRLLICSRNSLQLKSHS